MLKKVMFTVILAFLMFTICAPVFASPLEDIPRNAAMAFFNAAFWISLSAGIFVAGWAILKGEIKRAVIVGIGAGIFCALCLTPTILSAFGVDLLRIIGFSD